MRNKNVNNEMKAAALEDWVNGVPAKDIANKYGICEPTVAHWVNDYWLYYRGEEKELLVIKSKV